MDTLRRDDGWGDAISLGACLGLRVAGDIRLSAAADGGSEKEAELLGDLSPPPDPSEEAALECEVGGFRREADSGCPFHRYADEALDGVLGMMRPTGFGGTGFAVTRLPSP